MTANSKMASIAKAAATAAQRELMASDEVAQLLPDEQSDILLFVASELVAAAAQKVSCGNPGIPVVELLLLSKRIASLTKSGLGADDDA